MGFESSSEPRPRSRRVRSPALLPARRPTPLQGHAGVISNFSDIPHALATLLRVHRGSLRDFNERDFWASTVGCVSNLL